MRNLICRMRNLATITAIMLFASAANAQRQIVVADMDTRLPLPGAAILTDNGQRVMTDYLGRASASMPFGSATVSKKHYMQRRVDYGEALRDTVFLIPQEVVLKDVVVTAPSTSMDLKKSLQGISENAKLTMQAQQGFNLLGIFNLLFPSRKEKSLTRSEKIQKILDSY